MYVNYVFVVFEETNAGTIFLAWRMEDLFWAMNIITVTSSQQLSRYTIFKRRGKKKKSLTQTTGFLSTHLVMPMQRFTRSQAELEETPTLFCKETLEIES